MDYFQKAGIFLNKLEAISKAPKVGKAISFSL